MRRVKPVWVILIAGTAAVLLWQSNTDSATDWSQAEKENAAHFVYATRAAQKGIRASNEMGPGVSTQSDLQPILKAFRMAAKEAEVVRDSVLAKIDPRLPNRFRNEFEKGLKLRIKNLEQGDTQAEMEGARLLDSWADFYQANRHEWRIPKP